MTRLIFSCSFLLIICSLSAQSRSELEERRNALLRQIEQNKKTLRDTEKQSEQILLQAKALSNQIALRQELLNTMTSEINSIDRSIRTSQRTLERLKSDQHNLLEAQAGQLRAFYIRKKLENPLVFLLSSQNVNEAVARWQYMSAVSRARKATLLKVKSQQDSISIVVEGLKAMRADKLVLAENTVAQERELVQEKRSAESALASFQAKENEIRTLIDRQTRETEKLDREIERIIAAEVEKSEEPAGLPDAPELAALTNEFSGNKGKLPWPIDHGNPRDRRGH